MVPVFFPFLPCLSNQPAPTDHPPSQPAGKQAELGRVCHPTDDGFITTSTSSSSPRPLCPHNHLIDVSDDDHSYYDLQERANRRNRKQRQEKNTSLSTSPRSSKPTHHTRTSTSAFPIERASPIIVYNQRKTPRLAAVLSIVNATPRPS